VDERASVTRLIRAVCAFVLVPTVSIGAVLALYSWSDHWLHATGFGALSVAAVVAFARAPRLAARWVPEPEPSPAASA